MNNMTPNRVGVIQNVDDTGITIKLPDTGETIRWPLSEGVSSNEQLTVGSPVSLQLEIQPPQEPSKQNEKDTDESARMRKILEQILN